MHILIISRSYPNKINKTSGNFVKNQVEALSKQNAKIGILGVYNISVFELFANNNIKNIGFYSDKNMNGFEWGFLYPVIPKLHFINNRIKYYIGKKILKNYIRKHGKPDVIHLHTFEPGLLAIWAKKKYGISYIVTEHTSLFKTNKAKYWHKKLAKKVYNLSSYNIAVSKSSVDDLTNMFDCKFNYFPNFVNTSKFYSETKKTDETFNFINVAYLNKNKNHKLLIDAFNKAFGNNEKYQLTIVGKGEERKNIEEQIKKLNLQNVKLHGFAKQNELVELLNNSDYFVLSSNFETFGVVIIEAMSCGLPVVSTSSGGVETIIVNDKLGIICQKGNINDLSIAMKEVVTSVYDSNYIREFAIENFSYETLSKKLVKIYSKVKST